MEPFVVSRITFPYTRLIDKDEVFHQSVEVRDAMNMAKQSGLNLVCFSMPEQGKAALCKLINYEKWHYHHLKTMKKDKKKQKDTKELRFSYNIGDHDIEHKVKQAKEFLDDGDDVLMTMRMVGRERRFIKEGKEKMNSIVAMCLSHGKVVMQKEYEGLISVKLTK